MPPPKTANEVKQFLRLAGYYCKFVPRFADLSRPLTNLTRQKVEFEWTDKCQKLFDNLRELLMKYPILWYPDKDYLLMPVNLYILGCSQRSMKTMALKNIIRSAMLVSYSEVAS